MKYICSAHSSNDNYNGDCDWMIIDLTVRDIEQLIAWMEEAKARRAGDINFFCFEYFTSLDCYSDATLEYLAPNWLTDTRHEKMNSNFIRFPIAERADWPDQEGEAIEQCTVQITANTCQWFCQPKHDDTVIRSALVERSELEAWLKGVRNDT